METVILGNTHGREDQCTDLHGKSCVAPRIRVHHDATDISSYLPSTPKHYEKAVKPSSELDRKARVYDEKDGEERQEERIRA
jgi:hypothetical protein